MIRPKRIREMLEQVKNNDLGVQDYDFLDEVTHPAPKQKGNNGLSSIGAWLAVYEEDGELTVDQELVQALDEKQAELEGVGERNRFRNIVMDSENRPGGKKSLLDQGMDGHEFLQNMVEEFEKETSGIEMGYREETEQKKRKERSIQDSENQYLIRADTSVGLDLLTRADGGKNQGVEPNYQEEQKNEYGSDPSTQASKNNINSSQNREETEGGENEMGLLEDMSGDAQEYMEEGMGVFEAYEHVIDDYREALNESDMRFSSVETALREELAEIHETGADLERVIGRLEGKIESGRKEREDTMDSIRAAYDNITDR